jgi:arylsulfotransferase ASST
MESEPSRGGRRGAELVAVALASLPLLAGCGASGVASASATTTQPYVLFAPIAATNTYLMDLNGQLVHQWSAASAPACSVVLLEDGTLLRPRSLGDTMFPGGGCNGGRVELLDWDGTVKWSYEYSAADHQQHHDVKRMPNGHVLMIAWEKRTSAEGQAAGRNTVPGNGEIWVDHVIEVDPATNAIVWVWRVWDHLLAPGDDPSAHPELFDPNIGPLAQSDWTHANAIDYNPDLDQIAISLRNFSEFVVIDHSTTTAEAAGHTGGRSGRGGDLLYRWGNPANYGMPGPEQIFGQHNAHWIEAGRPGAGQLLLFDNGAAGLRPYSTAVQLAPVVAPNGTYAYDPETGFLPAEPVWRYVASPPESLFARIVSSAQRLPSGNTLLCDGPAGHFIEVTSDGQTVWSYTVTDTTGANNILTFRATRYEPGFPGLTGKELPPTGPVRVELPATASSKSQPAT